MEQYKRQLYQSTKWEYNKIIIEPAFPLSYTREQPNDIFQNKSESVAKYSLFIHTREGTELKILALLPACYWKTAALVSKVTVAPSPREINSSTLLRLYLWNGSFDLAVLPNSFNAVLFFIQAAHTVTRQIEHYIIIRFAQKRFDFRDFKRNRLQNRPELFVGISFCEYFPNCGLGKDVGCESKTKDKHQRGGKEPLLLWLFFIEAPVIYLWLSDKSRNFSFSYNYLSKYSTKT